MWTGPRTHVAQPGRRLGGRKGPFGQPGRHQEALDAERIFDSPEGRKGPRGQAGRP